ncbi:MAG TPA: LLM class F420-dependent oxidoreductase [Acidimicrobiales bacterium]|nr:LLM class F420-dependent oxidoreductase [Acidimicrobiales bacterium]
MELGIHQIRFDFPGGTETIAPIVAATAKTAEEVGVASFTFMDHWFQMEHMAPATDPMLEGYTALGYVAALTSTMRLSLLVTGVTYRHPGLLAKIVTTLDVLSGGRAQLGIGAAWDEREHLALGVPFPPVSERFERLEETLQICRQMWSDDEGPFDGKHYHLAETICRPRPLSQPHPPILIGGGGERKTLRLVAKYADACNLFAFDYDETARKVAILNQHCENQGRDPNSVKKTVLYIGDPVGAPDKFLADAERYAGLGVSLMDLAPQGDPVEFVAKTGDLVGRLRDIG